MRNTKSAINYRNPALVRKIGFEALRKALGPVGLAYFIRQFEQGAGDYTAERHAVLDKMSLEDIERELEKISQPT